jgi:hypothetical protein
MYFLSDKHIQTFFNLTFPGANSVANAWLRLTTGFPTPAQQFLNFCKSFTDVRKVTSKKGWQITFRVIKRDRTVMIWNITEDVFLNNFDPKRVKEKFAFNHPMFPNCIICHLSMSSPKKSHIHQICQYDPYHETYQRLRSVTMIDSAFTTWSFLCFQSIVC